MKTDASEVVDGANHPVCVMPMIEISRQKLLHRAVGLVLRSPSGRMLLRWRAEGFDLSSYAMLPAGLSAVDFCPLLRKKDWKLEGDSFRRIALLPPSRETGNAFASIFESRVSDALALNLARDPEKSALLDNSELAAFVERGEFVSPLLSICAAKIFNPAP